MYICICVYTYIHIYIYYTYHIMYSSLLLLFFKAVGLQDLGRGLPSPRRQLLQRGQQELPLEHVFYYKLSLSLLLLLSILLLLLSLSLSSLLLSLLLSLLSLLLLLLSLSFVCLKRCYLFSCLWSTCTSIRVRAKDERVPWLRSLMPLVLVKCVFIY